MNDNKAGKNLDALLTFVPEQARPYFDYIVELGRRSELTDEDLFVGFSPDLRTQFNNAEVRDLLDFLKGSSELAAKTSGKTPIQAVVQAHVFAASQPKVP